MAANQSISEEVRQRAREIQLRRRELLNLIHEEQLNGWRRSWEVKVTYKECPEAQAQLCPTIDYTANIADYAKSATFIYDSTRELIGYRAELRKLLGGVSPGTGVSLPTRQSNRTLRKRADAALRSALDFNGKVPALIKACP